MNLIILERRCRRCKKDLPDWHFKPNRKTCRTCLENLPYPKDTRTIIPRPRNPRRWWPENVLAHQPAKKAVGPCKLCKKKFTRTRIDQLYCSSKCRYEMKLRRKHETSY